MCEISCDLFLSNCLWLSSQSLFIFLLLGLLCFFGSLCLPVVPVTPLCCPGGGVNVIKLGSCGETFGVLFGLDGAPF